MEQVTQGTKERLMSDVNAVLVDAEDLLKQAAAASGEQAADLRRRAQSAMPAPRRGLSTLSTRSWTRPGMPPRPRITGCTIIHGPRWGLRPVSGC